MRAVEALAPGTRLRGGYYRLAGVVGIGGFSIVYKAANPQGKAVAVKELFPDGGRRRRLLGLWTLKSVRPTAAWRRLEQLTRDEFRTVKTLRHPNIVRAVELFGENGTLYLVLELLDGETLHTRLTRHPEGLSEADVLAMAFALSDALAYAHGKGVLHRDIKPSNVMIEKTGRVVLLDFGLAVPAQRHASHDRGGTLAYMAPEQARGETQTPAADVYGLAATLLHALTGRPPERDAAPANPRPGSRIAATLAGALAPDPAARPQSMEEFRRELQGLPRPARAARLGRRRRWRRWLWIVVVLVAGAAAWWAFQASRDVSPRSHDYK